MYLKMKYLPPVYPFQNLRMFHSLVSNRKLILYRRARNSSLAHFLTRYTKYLTGLGGGGGERDCLIIIIILKALLDQTP